MADNKGLGLQETKGSFQISGVVTGTQSDKFYKEIMTKNNKPMRLINFGVNVDKDKTVYLGLNGMERDTVVFSKQEGEGKNKKTTTKKVAWKDRFTFAEKDYKPLGVNVGVTKVTGKDGKEVNNKKVLVEYDACKEIGDNLVDDKSIFVKGKLEFSTYNNKHQTKFVPTQVSLCKDIDFEIEGFKPTADFKQTIIFMGITKRDDGKFVISAKIVGYNSIEDAEFIELDEKRASLFKKTLKPYNAITIGGIINVEKDTETVTESDNDGWGEVAMDKVKSPTVRELIITGADKSSIDATTYSEAIIEEALAKIKSSDTAKKDYGDSEDEWGAVDTSKATEADDEW